MLRILRCEVVSLLPCSKRTAARPEATAELQKGLAARSLLTGLDATGQLQAESAFKGSLLDSRLKSYVE